jgi:hypothetical protein
VITTPAVFSAFTTAIAAPSVDSLSERFAATFVLLRRFSIANSKSPQLQLMLLQSIIPAPVAVLNLFTSAAVIVAMFCIF